MLDVGICCGYCLRVELRCFGVTLDGLVLGLVAGFGGSVSFLLRVLLCRCLLDVVGC